jgi:hypothetical protein
VEGLRIPEGVAIVRQQALLFATVGEYEREQHRNSLLLYGKHHESELRAFLAALAPPPPVAKETKP